jgi:hypothetical protein
MMTLPETESISVTTETTNLAAKVIADELVEKLKSWFGEKGKPPVATYEAAFKLEDLVGQASLRTAYVDALETVVEGDEGILEWKLVHANPIQRGKAYLLMFA